METATSLARREKGNGKFRLAAEKKATKLSGKARLAGSEDSNKNNNKIKVYTD